MIVKMTEMTTGTCDACNHLTEVVHVQFAGGYSPNLCKADLWKAIKVRSPEFAPKKKGGADVAVARTGAA